MQGSHVVSCALDGQVRLHEVVSDKVISSSRLFQHDGAAHKLSIAPNDPFVFVSCGEDGVVAQIDVRRPPKQRAAAELFRLSSPDHDELAAFFVDHDRTGRYLLVGGDACLVQVYDLRRASGGPLAVIPERLQPFRRSVCATGGQWRQDGKQFCATYNNAFAATFSFTGRDSLDEVTSAIYLPVSEQHPAASTEAPVSAEVDSGASVASNTWSSHEAMFYRFHQNAATIKGITYMGPEGEWIVSGCDSGNVVFYRSSDGSVRHVTRGDRRGAVNCLSPHPMHLPILLTSGLEHDAKVWRAGGNSTDPTDIRAWCSRMSRHESLDPLAWVPTADLLLETADAESSDGSGTGELEISASDDEGTDAGLSGATDSSGNSSAMSEQDGHQPAGASSSIASDDSSQQSSFEIGDPPIDLHNENGDAVFATDFSSASSNSSMNGESDDSEMGSQQEVRLLEGHLLGG